MTTEGAMPVSKNNNDENKNLSRSTRIWCCVFSFSEEELAEQRVLVGSNKQTLSYEFRSKDSRVNYE